MNSERSPRFFTFSKTVTVCLLLATVWAGFSARAGQAALRGFDFTTLPVGALEAQRPDTFGSAPDPRNGPLFQFSILSRRALRGASLTSPRQARDRTS